MSGGVAILWKNKSNKQTKDEQTKKICTTYDDLLNVLYDSRKPYCKHKNKMCNIRPGWNKYAAEEI